jgi:hypothetical protein
MAVSFILVRNAIRPIDEPQNGVEAVESSQIFD